MEHNLRLSPLFSDHLIVQRGVSIPLWGIAAPRAAVVVTMDKTYQARADQSGAWQVALDPVPAGGPYSIEIAANGEKITLSDIYSGDVWLAAGQSNMELPMQRIRDSYQEEWNVSVYPPIHQYTVPQEWDFSGPRQELSGGCWTAASAETLGDFSGTAWFFAKRIYESQKIPVGIINTAWGGTPVESWMSREALEAFPGKAELAAIMANETLAGEIDRVNEIHIRNWEALLDAQDRGLAEAWYRPETSLTQWNEMLMPGDFSEAGITEFCGVIWLCRDIDISAELAAADSVICLGTIVDADTVYINGRNIGSVTYRYPPRKYRIPAGLLREGKNRIAVRVSSASGVGGITRDKPFCIFSEKGCSELKGTWKYRVGMAAPPKPAPLFFQRLPAGPYNAMIAPLHKYPVKGIIWYQAESNGGSPGEYGPLFNAMILDWRKKAGRDDLPFIFVQLPIFGRETGNTRDSSWAALREAQQTALNLPGTAMAVALELGEWNDLHPLNKKDVGIRLALAAEKTAYGAENTSPGPLFRGLIKSHDRLILNFDNCGTGLCCREEPFVSIVCANGQLRLPAVIESPDSISIDISSIKNPVEVLYAWADNPLDRQLFNSEGLPMLPFKAGLLNS